MLEITIILMYQMEDLWKRPHILHRLKKFYRLMKAQISLLRSSLIYIRSRNITMSISTLATKMRLESQLQEKWTDFELRVSTVY